jgi:hypothetical protein
MESKMSALALMLPQVKKLNCERTPSIQFLKDSEHVALLSYWILPILRYFKKENMFRWLDLLPSSVGGFEDCLLE